MIVEALKKVVDGNNLPLEEAQAVMGEIMKGDATDAQIAALITALRMKGETVDEISGFAKAMRSEATTVKTKAVELVDTCGTGGDLSNTFNISTAAAFVVAGAGVHVAKHGNRSVSSKSGSADVLEALGVNLELPAAQVGKAIDEVGIGFLFAPMLHPAMKHAIGPRREMGIRTVFNILGPLTNPAYATRQCLGVYEEKLTETLALVLGNLGIKRAMVVHGADGLDEISNTGESVVSELAHGKVDTYTVTPEQFGIPRVERKDLLGGSAEENAEILKAILAGEKGPKRDIVLLNAGAALIAAGAAANFMEGLELAAQSIDTGKSREKLDELVAFSQRSG